MKEGEKTVGKVALRVLLLVMPMVFLLMPAYAEPYISDISIDPFNWDSYYISGVVKVSAYVEDLEGFGINSVQFIIEEEEVGETDVYCDGVQDEFDSLWWSCEINSSVLSDSSSSMYDLKVDAYDDLGSSSTSYFSWNEDYFDIDNTPPEAYDDYGEKNDTWQVEWQQIYLWSSDSESDVQTILYCTNTANECEFEEEWSSEASVDVWDEGVTYLRYSATDYAGNRGLEKFLIVKIDANQPEISDPSIQLQNDFASGVVNVSAMVTDSASGISSVAFTITDLRGDIILSRTENEASCDGTGNESNIWSCQINTSSLPDSSFGTYNLKIEAADNAGNSNSAYYTDYGNNNFDIDNTNPATSDDYVDEQGGSKSGTWQSSAQQIALNEYDELSGISSASYCIDSADECSPDILYSNPVEVGNEGMSYFRYSSEDNAGNRQGTVSVIVKIDTMAPNTSDDYSERNGSWQNSGQNITLRPDDAGSGVLETRHCMDFNDTCEPDAVYEGQVYAGSEGISYFRYMSVDNFGHEQAVVSRPIKIDFHAPDMSDDYGQKNGTWQTLNQTITISANDSGSGVKNLSYCIDENNTCRPGALSKGAVLVEGEGTRYLRHSSADSAGNEDLKFVIVKIDYSVPSLNYALLNPASIKKGGNLTITASANDSVSEASVFRTIFNSSGILSEVMLEKGSTWMIADEISSEWAEGAYFVNVTAIDEAGNKAVKEMNFTVGAEGAKAAVTNASLNASPEEPLVLNNSLSGTRVDLEITPDDNVSDAAVSIAEYSTASNTGSVGTPSLGKYVEITASENLLDSLSHAVIKIYYTDEEVAAANVVEDTLRMYFYNETSGSWEKYDSPRGGIDTLSNFVWANTTHFSTWGAFGSSAASSSSSGGGGGAGGGGGGGSYSLACGDGRCGTAETPANCPQDCAPKTAPKTEQQESVELPAPEQPEQPAEETSPEPVSEPEIVPEPEIVEMESGTQTGLAGITGGVVRTVSSPSPALVVIVLALMLGAGYVFFRKK